MKASDTMRESSLGYDLLQAARYYFGGRRGLLLLGSGIIIAALVFNWSWLAAVAVTPLLLSLLPCIAMCALGLCMSKMMGGSCSGEKDKRDSQALPVSPDPNQLTLGMDMPGSSAEATVASRPTAATD